MGIKTFAQRAINAVWHMRNKSGASGVQVRGFNAAKIDNLTHSWNSTPESPDEIQIRELNVLKARSREQLRNNDYGKKFKQMVKTNIVGPNGIVLQSRIVDYKGKPDKVARLGVENAFKDWGKAKNCSISGEITWKEQQDLFANTVCEDGEYLARIHFKGPYKFQIEPIDTVLLDPSNNQDNLDGGRFIRLGIEFNADQKPIAYWLLTNKNATTYDAAWSGKKYVRVPAGQIIHRFIRERVGQKRGIPWASTSLFRLNMLSGLEDASLVAHRIGASKMGIMTTPSGDGYTGHGTGADGHTIEYAEPGTMAQVPAGTEFHKFDPDYPADIEGASKLALRGVSSGLGVSYNALANDGEGINFSTMRSFLLEDRECWKDLQGWMIEKFNAEIYDLWLQSALATGRILIAGRQANRGYEYYQPVKFQGRRWAWVDPLKDEQAAALSIKTGTKSRSAIIRDRGEDPDDVWQEIAAERKQMQALDIPIHDGELTETVQTENEEQQTNAD